MTDINSWALPPGAKDLPSGQLIRYRKIFEPPMTSRPVRKSGQEPMVIVAETGNFVIYRVWSSKGVDLGERCMAKEDFDAEFERGAVIHYLPGEGA